MKRILASLFLLLGLSLAQVGLANSQIHAVRGFMPDLKFTLISAHKPEFTEKDVRGKVVLMFFGYANCPDICPTSMAQLADVMEKLGNDAEKVRILFVSVDPHRDTAPMLQEYVENFDDRYALGLTGTPQQIADLARRYRVAYQIEKPRGDNPNAYEVSHSRGVYFFDTKGKARYLASDSEEVEALVEKVRSLL
ncbi:protein SCO1/2 [Paenalcaligenes hominis]|uniref:Protein SCO1/2 n=1 Tax=Paenalcaligenes hominis TaxID=643674 RepID=A0ABX0WNW4_9BURK|nr:SCO family protein [Paenalcaligenes hominis]NJB64445.1 protein SCO1/2 [Paenalcaligenes hominis]GGE67611.1 electron transporter [Paenalcaligenes hominis]